MVQRKALSRDARQWGYNLEEKAYRLLNMVSPNIHTNIRLPRPKYYEQKKGFYTKKYEEADIIFQYKKKLYIVQCKRRKSRYSKSPKFFVTPDAKELYLNGRNVTAKYLSNLWHTKQYLRHHRIWKAYGEPEIKTILLVDAQLQIGKTKKSIGMVRDSYILRIEDLPEFLRFLRTPPQNNLKDSIGNIRVSEKNEKEDNGECKA